MLETPNIQMEIIVGVIKIIGRAKPILCKYSIVTIWNELEAKLYLNSNFASEHSEQIKEQRGDCLDDEGVERSIDQH